MFVQMPIVLYSQLQTVKLSLLHSWYCHIITVGVYTINRLRDWNYRFNNIEGIIITLRIEVLWKRVGYYQGIMLCNGVILNVYVKVVWILICRSEIMSWNVFISVTDTFWNNMYILFYNLIQLKLCTNRKIQSHYYLFAYKPCYN